MAGMQNSAKADRSIASTTNQELDISVAVIECTSLYDTPNPGHTLLPALVRIIGLQSGIHDCEAFS